MARHKGKSNMRTIIVCLCSSPRGACGGKKRRSDRGGAGAHIVLEGELSESMQGFPNLKSARRRGLFPRVSQQMNWDLRKVTGIPLLCSTYRARSRGMPLLVGKREEKEKELVAQPRHSTNSSHSDTLFPKQPPTARGSCPTLNYGKLYVFRDYPQSFHDHH